MKIRRILSRTASLLLLATAYLTASAAKPGGAPADFDAAVAFMKLPGDYVDLISPATRAEMVAHFQADSILRPLNNMMGRSELVRLTPEYLKVKLTAVSSLQIRLLPAKSGPVVATVYTIDNGVGAPDSELRFFTPDMVEIPLRKIFTEPDMKNFFPTLRNNPQKLKQMIQAMPFPTVEYSFSEETTELSGQITVGHYMTREAYETIRPYLASGLSYVWTGTRYQLSPPGRK